MHYLYIIHSKSTDKFYIGETHDVENRIARHSAHYYSNSFTKIAEDWELKLSFECANENDAQYLERFVKRMKSKKFILKVIEHPKILNDLLYKK